jgi:hypothetical protein
VELSSQSGETCSLKNPWGNAQVDLYRNGKKVENLSGSLLTFKPANCETIIVLPAGATPDQFKQTVPYYLGMKVTH